MLNVYFLSTQAVCHAEELRKDNKLLGTFDLGDYTAIIVETNAAQGYFYVDHHRFVVSRAIRDNRSNLLVQLERALLEKLQCPHKTCELGFTNHGMSFMVHASPLAKDPVVFLEYQIVCPEFYHGLI